MNRNISKSSFADDIETEKFKGWLSQFQLSERTIIEYAKVRKQFLKEYEGITQENINRFLRKCPTTLYYFAIKKLLEYSSRADIALKKKFRFRAIKKRLNVPTRAQLDDIMKRRIANEKRINPDVFYMLRIHYLTGMRKEESLALRLSNLDDEGLIKFMTKGGEERVVRLPLSFFQELKQYLTEEKGLLGNDRLFFSNTKNTASAFRAFREQLYKLQTGGKDAEIQAVMQTHNFRRAIINELIEKKGIYIASRFIGHKRITTTERYASEQQKARAEEEGYKVIFEGM